MHGRINNSMAHAWRINNIMAHAWEDKVRKCFVSTHSTTLPAKPSNKRRWREMIDEDGEEVGQTEVFTKLSSEESYFGAASNL